MQARPSRPSSIRQVLTTGSSRVGRNARTNFDGSGHSSAADFQNSGYAEVRPPSESRTNQLRKSSLTASRLLPWRPCLLVVTLGLLGVAFYRAMLAVRAW